MKKPADRQKKPKAAATSQRLPVNVRTYFKKGKRIKGYKRHKAGDAQADEKRGV